MYEVVRLEPYEWLTISQEAHTVVFGTIRPPELDRISYALAIKKNGVIGGFATVIEMDQETAYLQHGGVFPNFESSTSVLAGYLALLEKLSTEYKYIWTRVENTNVRYLKLALKAGFLVNGVSTFKQKLLLELFKEV